MKEFSFSTQLTTPSSPPLNSKPPSPNHYLETWSSNIITQIPTFCNEKKIKISFFYVTFLLIWTMLIFTKLFIQNDYLTFDFLSWPTWGQYSFSHLPLPQLHFPSNLFILHHPWIYSPLLLFIPLPRLSDSYSRRKFYWCLPKNELIFGALQKC